jgi:hypothetical protein
MTQCCGTKTTEKPQIIATYSWNTRDTDISDMVLYAYLDDRKKIKYWKKVAFNIVTRMALNTYILYKEN